MSFFYFMNIFFINYQNKSMRKIIDNEILKSSDVKETVYKPFPKRVKNEN